MHLVGARGQFVRDFKYDASGVIASGTAPQLILPEQPNRTSLEIQNISTSAMYVEFGGARASASLTANKLSSIAVNNGGFGYTIPPEVIFFGGGDIKKNPTYLCPGLPGNITPGKIPTAHAVLTAGVVTSIVIDDPGAAVYSQPPMVFLRSSQQDPYGAAIPSATSGLLLAANGGSMFYNGTTTSTDAISIFCATQGAVFTCKYTIGG